MDAVLDFVFGIAWWQWLAGTLVIAGAVFVSMQYIIPAIKRARQERLEEQLRMEDEARQQQLLAELEKREKERQKLLQQVPSGPVEKVSLPPATVKARNIVHKLPTDRDFTIGSDRGANVQIARPGVLRQHAKIRPEPQGYVLYDLFGETGTLLNGQRIAKKVLRHGDRIQIEKEVIVFECPAQAKAAGQKPRV